MLLVIDDVGFLPVAYPVAYFIHLEFSIRRRTYHTVQAGVDDHFLADKTGERIDRAFCFRYTSKNVHIPTQKADASPGCIDDGVLFSMHAAA